MRKDIVTDELNDFDIDFDSDNSIDVIDSGDVVLDDIDIDLMDDTTNTINKDSSLDMTVEKIANTIEDEADEDDDMEIDFGDEPVQIHQIQSEPEQMMTSEPVEIQKQAEIEVGQTKEQAQTKAEQEQTEINQEQTKQVEDLQQSKKHFSKVKHHNVSISKPQTSNKAVIDDDNERSQDKDNYILYLIADKTFPGMLSYFRYYGLKVTKIFSNIEEAKDTLLMQIEPCKIVVVDSGTGKFTSISARRSLIDLLSISDETNKVSVFYTDSIIRSEAKNEISIEEKDITWHKYRSTADVLANLLQNLIKEHYVYDIKDAEEVDKSEELLTFQGASFKHVEPMKIGLPSLKLFEILQHESDNAAGAEGELPGYKIKI